MSSTSAMPHWPCKQLPVLAPVARTAAVVHVRHGKAREVQNCTLRSSVSRVAVVGPPWPITISGGRSAGRAAQTAVARRIEEACVVHLAACRRERRSRSATETKDRHKPACHGNSRGFLRWPVSKADSGQPLPARSATEATITDVSVAVSQSSGSSIAVRTTRERHVARRRVRQRFEDARITVNDGDIPPPAFGARRHQPPRRRACPRRGAEDPFGPAEFGALRCRRQDR